MRILSSLWGRVFSLLLLGVVLSAALTWWLAFGERQKTISQFRDSHVIERAEQLVLALNALPAANREAFLATAPRLGLKVTTLPAVSPNKVPISHYAEAISDRLGKNFRVISLLQDPQSCPRLSGNHNQLLPLPCEALGITLSDGSALRLTIVPPRGPAPPLRPEFIQYLLIFLGSIAIMAFLIARMTMRPLQKMAQAATDLGQDINRPPLPESGAREILQATRAFNAMQARIRQHIAQRTHMLAAITH
ncbi:MAG: HAMP domain-containing protein, partial [Burkholderiales bacterium]|nr:HAMP domain-containing protein [Burkholderiales bacterium]